MGAKACPNENGIQNEVNKDESESFIWKWKHKRLLPISLSGWRHWYPGWTTIRLSPNSNGDLPNVSPLPSSSRPFGLLNSDILCKPRTAFIWFGFKMLLRPLRFPEIVRWNDFHRSRREVQSHDGQTNLMKRNENRKKCVSDWLVRRNGYVFDTHLHTQWAAVTSQRLLIIVAPQKWPPRRVRLAMNGSVPRIASSPPTMRPYRVAIPSDSVAHGIEETEMHHICNKIWTLKSIAVNHCQICFQFQFRATIAMHTIN